MVIPATPPDDRLTALIDHSDDLIWSVDRNYCLTAANRAFYQRLQAMQPGGVSLGACLLSEHYSPEICDEWRGYYDRALAGERFHVTREWLVDGQILCIDCHFGPIRSPQDEISGVTVIGRDATEQDATEQALRESEARFRTLIEAAPGAILVMQERQYVYANPAASRMLGYAPGELVGQDVLVCIHPEAIPLILERLRLAVEGKPAPPMEMKVLRKDRQTVLVESTSVPIVWNARPATLIVSQDITQRLEMEEVLREQRRDLARAQAVAHLGNYIWDAENNTTYWSDEMYEITGLQGHAPGFQALLDLTHADDRRRVIEIWQQAQEAGGPLTSEFRILRHDGSLRWVKDQISVDLDQQGKLVRMFGTLLDITARKNTEQQLRAALAEKETLLKEVHHRVKNNLSIISSLLSLQAEQVSDPLAHQALLDSRQRVYSMARVHEDLYRSKDLTHIRFDEYLTGLAEFLMMSINPDPGIRLELALDAVGLTVEKAIPCGMWVNEILTNAFKHAFPDGKGGLVRIQLTHQNEMVLLQVSDDGIGLPADVAIDSADTLGLQLVKLLTQQLQAQQSIRRENGTAYALSFQK